MRDSVTDVSTPSRYTFGNLCFLHAASRVVECYYIQNVVTFWMKEVTRLSKRQRLVQQRMERASVAQG